VAEPACSIDKYDRAFSLSFGLGPDLAPSDRSTYLSDLDADAGFLHLDRPGRVEHDPRLPADRRVRALEFSGNAARTVVLPRTTASFGAPVEPAQAAIDAVAIRSPPAAVPQGGKTLAEVAASRFRWDDFARSASALPIPTYTDESLVISWATEPSLTAPLGNTIPGIVADQTSEFLLATSPGLGNGELDLKLLRAPVIGLVRFERYRHLILEGGALSVGRPSNAGAIVIRALGGQAVASPSGAPILRSHMVVLENVSAESAAMCLANLTFCVLARRSDVLKLAFFTAPFRKSVVLLFKTWIAYLKVIGPTPNPLPTLPAAMRAPFEAAGDPTLPQIEQLVNHCLTTANVKTSLVNFIQNQFAPLLCGASWKQIGIDLPVTPVAPLLREFRELEALMTSADTWLPCFAGCPVGKAARAYQVPNSATAASPALRPLAELTTFDLEALIVSDWAAFAFPAVTPAAAPDDFHTLDLSPFDSVHGGYLASFRVVDGSMTTPDWLSMAINGTNATAQFAPPVDFSSAATDGHPLAGAVGWSRFMTARDARTRLNTLRSANVTGRNVRVARANLDWWITTTNVLVAGNWPVVVPGAGPGAIPPTPSNPYGVGTTVTARTAPGANTNLPSGFDEFDLEAVLEAQAVVKNGRTHAADLDAGLFLALLDREGLKTVGGFERTATPRTFGALPAAWGGFTTRDLTDVSIVNWLVFPFGLDLLVRGDITNVNAHPLLVSPTDVGFANRFRTTYSALAQRLVNTDILPATWEPMMSPERMLAVLERRKLGRNAAGTLTATTLTRSALTLGIILQQATFQWVHNRLSLATRNRGEPVPVPEDFAWVKVDELTTGAPPTPGPDALAAQRRKYIAYWALVYLAFNTSPPTWNAWVNAVPAAALANTTVSEFLVYHANANPAALEPPGGAPRTLGQRGNMLRFAAGLDAYLRLNLGGAAVDTADPNSRPAAAWPVT
jgi:hypothetical protein